uniref:Complex III assembly factor LYRM7 n=1 Tax=Rhipicephalus microplus TaxID=6941 RepID=A0A6M2CUB0_RHIMP
MSGSARSLVLNSYKSLHRVILQVFEGDPETIRAAKVRVKEEYVKNLHETDSRKIEELLKTAKDVEKVLQTDLIKAVRNEKGNYEVQLKPHPLQDNATCKPHDANEPR